MHGYEVTLGHSDVMESRGFVAMVFLCVYHRHSGRHYVARCQSTSHIYTPGHAESEI